jgi:hypothetical protein
MYQDTLGCIAGCGLLTARRVRDIRVPLSRRPASAANGYSAKKFPNGLERQVIPAAIYHGHFGASYQNLTTFIPGPLYFTYCNLNSHQPWEAFTRRVAVGSQRFGWATSCRNGRATVLWLWAASGLSIESSNVLSILGKDSQGTSRTREGQTG